MSTTPSGPLHPDFAGLRPEPGHATIEARPELFSITNVIAFGGDAERRTHVPTDLGRCGSAVIWESTGASDALPFWNTNRRSDMWLYIVAGGVRVELKAVERPERYGEYVARTGDLFRLPVDVAHRTFSLDGKRRITLEFLEQDPRWGEIGALADVAAAPTLGLGGFTVDLDDVASGFVRVSAGGHEVREPVAFFQRGLRALDAWELHLGHNEFEGGFVVDDGDAAVTLKIPGHAETHPTADVLALVRAVLARLPA